MSRRRCLWLAASVWLASPALRGGDGVCGPAPPPAPEAVDVETRLILVGDAGAPSAKGEPVLQALSQALSRDPARTRVVFLGDNVYPDGLPATGKGKRRDEAVRRLTAQIEAVRAAKDRAIFIPGNHDWAQQGDEGWEAVRRQASFVKERGASFLPEGGCPGPSVEDVGEKLRLVVLDTQWFLHAGPKPSGPGSGCRAGTENEFATALRDDLASAGGRQVVVLAHHPLVSGGTHSGHFGFTDHVFPLLAKKPWLWIPLPGLGSIYPIARRAGISSQDSSSAVNERMRTAIETVLRERPPLVYAAGHEHNLQVLGGTSARHLLVSGGGIFDHATRAVCIERSRFALARAGFMRLDVERSGRVRLSVLEVDRGGSAFERYAQWLD